MKEIEKQKHTGEDGRRYATAAGCPYRCYQTNREGMALDICPRYTIAAVNGQTKECCREDTDEC